MVRASTYLVLVVAFVAGAGACDLEDVVIPEGQPLVVVHGVMRPDVPQQYVILERTFTGTVNYDFEVTPTVPTEDGPRLPITGASVTVSNLGYPDDPCGPTVSFETLYGPPGMRQQGVYWSPSGCPSMRPGDLLRLRVQTAELEIVTGTTTVPGINTAHFTVARDSFPFGTDTVAVFNRDRDTLRVWVDPVAGRLLQIEVLRTGYLDNLVGTDIQPGAKVFADSTCIAMPGDLIDVFERGEGEDVFRAGRHYVLSAALTDTNYFDFARSRNSKYTGRGFINRLEGGIGVFGSLAATSARIKTVGDAEDRREGVYRLQGVIMGIDIDAELSVFLARALEEAEFSGFLDGNWFTTAGGAEGAKIWVPYSADSRSVDGHLTGDSLFAVTFQPGYHETLKLRLTGSWVSGAPFPVKVVQVTSTSLIDRGTLTAVQQ